MTISGYGGWILWGTSNSNEATAKPVAGDPAVIFSFNWDGSTGLDKGEFLDPTNDNVKLYSAVWDATHNMFIPTVTNKVQAGWSCYVDATIN
jgi:hypothetical protein